MKRFRAGIAVALTILLVWPSVAWAGGSCSIYKSWSTGDSLTASDLTTSFTTVGVTNDTLSCLDDYSSNTAQMQTATDPYAAKTESLATSGAGELERLRFVIERAFGWSSWYKHTDNIDFNHRASAVDGSGLGRHVTAVGFHSWSGSNRWPAITSVATHTTGLLWGQPGALTLGGAANHHLTVMIDATVDSGRFGVGQTNARTWYSFHAAALTLHHTAALRFAHSESQMHAGQRGHVTALRINPATDQVIFGHAGTALRFEGAGYTEGANRLLMLADNAQALQARQIAVSGTLTLTHTASVLTIGSGAAAAADMVKEGGSDTEVTTTSTSLADGQTFTSLSIPTTSGIVIRGRYRKTSGAAEAVYLGLVLNTTEMTGATGFQSTSTGNENNPGTFQIVIPPLADTTYGGFWFHALDAANGASWFNATTTLRPNATITTITVRLRSGNASITVGNNYTRVYSYK